MVSHPINHVKLLSLLFCGVVRICSWCHDLCVSDVCDQARLLTFWLRGELVAFHQVGRRSQFCPVTSVRWRTSEHNTTSSRAVSGGSACLFRGQAVDWNRCVSRRVDTLQAGHISVPM